MANLTPIFASWQLAKLFRIKKLAFLKKISKIDIVSIQDRVVNYPTVYGLLNIVYNEPKKLLVIVTKSVGAITGSNYQYY